MTDDREARRESIDDMKEKYAGSSFSMSPDPKLIPSPRKREKKKIVAGKLDITDWFNKDTS